MALRREAPLPESGPPAIQGRAAARKARASRADFEPSSCCVGARKEFFVDGFAKSDRDDIRRDELKAFRRLAGQMLTLDDKALAAAMRNGTIMEIECHG